MAPSTPSFIYLASSALEYNNAMSEAHATELPPEIDDVLEYLTTVAISLPKAVTEPEDLKPLAFTLFSV